MRQMSFKYKFILVFVFILCAVRDSESSDLKKNIKLKPTREAKEWRLVPESLWVLDGGTFMLRLDPSEKVDCPNGGCKCNVSAPHGQTFLQKPLTTEGKEFTISGAPDKLKIGLTALGGCYLLISSASYKASSGRWSINQNDGPTFNSVASVIV